jgi:2-keto-3-deoxy-L-rhamnonate aldolase RhmA
MASSLKQKLLANQPTLGTWLTIPDPIIAEIMAKAGFDWVAIDMEHTMTGLSKAGSLIQTIDLCGISALVRLTSNDANQIKRVMDAGADGVIVPMVNTRAEAEKAVAATRYMPAGNRGVGLYRAQDFGNGFKNYVEWQKAGPVVVVQIEHIDAVANLEQIISVDGVDAIMIGPYDLSCSMGIPGDFSRPEFQETLDKVNVIMKSTGKCSGIHIVEPDLHALSSHLDKGYKFIAYSVDMRVLDVGLRKGVEFFGRNCK